MRRLLLAFSFILSLGLAAQQPQTSTAPLQPLNAKYVQGVGVGFWPTPGTGLVLNVAPGTSNCGGSITSYSGGTLTMTASVTNYVYLDTTSSCTLSVKTTSFASTDIPIATVTASGSAITGIVDDRTMFQNPGVGSGGVGSSTACLFAYYATSGSTVIGNSKVCENGTNFTISEPIVSSDATGGAGTFTSTFGNTPSGVAGVSKLYADTANSRFMVNDNNTGAAYLPKVPVGSTIPAGNRMVAGSNGIDPVDGGAPLNCSTGVTITMDSGAGTSPSKTVSTGATDCSGYVQITVGSSPPTPSGANVTGFFDITFGVSHTPNLKCAIVPFNIAAGALVGTTAQPNIIPSGITSTKATAFLGSAALTAAAQLWYFWTCGI